MSESAAPQAARILPVQGVVNALIRAVLATPVLGRLVGRQLIVLYVIGRKSGTQYTIPVAYERDGEQLLIGTSARWARNLRTGDTLQVRFRGRREETQVQVDAGEAEAVADYATIVRQNSAFAKFNRIGVDSTGKPDAGDLRTAWQAGARGIRLTPLDGR